MGRMSGKTCIVTGGAGSIGLASACRLLEEGGNVMLVDRDDAHLAKALKSLTHHGNRVATTTSDVTQTSDTRNYIRKTLDKFGKIDVLFSNAGASGDIKPITDFPEADFDTVMAVNVRASFLACKYAVPYMNDGGSIIITSSIMGVKSNANIVAYATSKHAVVGLMRTVAKELAPRNIRVNVLAPGPVDNGFQTDIENRLGAALGLDATAMLNQIIPLGRHARPEEIAAMVLFLASDQSSFSTGSVFMADGGMSA